MRTNESAPYTISVVNVAARRRYEIRAGGTLVGFAQYRAPDEEHVDFMHTKIETGYERRGLASELVAQALADVRARGRRIIPHCPYVAQWLTRHHDFDDITDWPEGES